MEKTNQKLPNAGMSRRHFVRQAGVAGTTLMFAGLMPVQLFGMKKIPLKNGVQEQTVIAEGWRIKSLPPVTSLDNAVLAEATQTKESKEWLSVPLMPTMVHGILLDHRKIEEPWKPFGTAKCFWVSQMDWIYSVNFSAKATTGETRLIFKGLKGSVDVYLNGSPLTRHSEQSIPLIVDVTGKIISVNTLVLHFSKAAPKIKSGSPDPSLRTEIGTYFGPNPLIYTSGIFDEVILEHTDGSLITDIVTDFTLDDSLTEGTVNLSVKGRSRNKNVKVYVQLISPQGSVAAESSVETKVTNGVFNLQQKLSISKPQLWWPRGYGEQKLYKVEITLLIDGNVHQKEHRTIGFRRITMPEDLHFLVNGVSVFLRGGDWVTPDILSDVWDQEREEMLFAMAENANFNAFRIWGVVEAPNDNFYEMADERGFLLWQDFTKMPFYQNSDKIEESKEIATKFLKRLKHHPCILMWCGINEAAMWSHEDYNPDFKDYGPWNGLPSAEAVGQVCKELDPDRHYIPSAPYGGINANDPREGSTNGYTNMWFVPGYDFLNFASEDTRIAAPPLQSMKKFMNPEEIFPEGYSTIALPGNKYPFPISWLPYTSTESWRKTGPVEQFYDATDAASLVNRIGMAEGLYYQDTVERQRRGRPAIEAGDRRCCGGYIVWKYNDSWPEIYSAKVDYFLEPYHAYYTLKEAFAPVILSFEIGIFIYLWAVNDSNKSVGGTVKIQLYHLGLCEFRKEIVREITIAPGKSMVVVQLDKAGIRAFRKEHILFASLTDKEGRVIARTNALSDIERRCIFPEANLNVTAKGNSLIITTDKFARNINLEGDNNGDRLGWFFSDNYFDLLPGEEKEVRILGKHQKGKITAWPWYSKNLTTLDWKLS